MDKIAIVGCGLVGQGWAAVFATAGFEVVLYDPQAEAANRALKSMATRIDDLIEFELVDSANAAKALQNITVASKIETAVEGAVYIQESGPEDVNVKREITQTLDALAGKNVPICSSTSGIAASRYCEHIEGRHRCLVVHPINPPHLIPAVEIVPSPWTEPGIISTVNDLLISCQRETIVLNEEIDGFVVNRLQGALLEESFKLIASGIVSATDLDKAVSHGLGLRWSFMGPMQTIHLNAPGGVTQYVERYGQMFRDFGIGPYDTVDWHEVATETLEAELGQKTSLAEIPAAQNDRDRKLMALLRHKAQSRTSNE